MQPEVLDFDQTVRSAKKHKFGFITTIHPKP